MDTDTESRVAEMTLEQQIGQLFGVGFAGTSATPELLALIQRDSVGSVILFSRNIRSREQTAALTAQLQAAAREAGHPAPLLLMTDQENGLVRRLGPDSTILPGNMALGAIDGGLADQMVYDVGQATARELLAHGINMDLAPVVDVNSNPANPVIGIRSFGEQAEQVARLGAAAVRGLQESGVIATLKHFPGHGDTAVDSHVALPIIGASRERLERVELVPFQRGIAAGAWAVMIAHVGLPALTAGKIRPATLAQPIVTGLLREQLGFDGLIVSDCLEMDAIARTVGTPRGAVMALQAGVDLVLISHRLDRQRAALEAVHAAVASGELDASRIREAAARVLKAKRHALSPQASAPAALPEALSAATLAAHRALRDTAYTRSATVVGDDAGELPLRLGPGEELLVVSCPSRAVSQAVDIPYADAPLVNAIRRHYPLVQALSLPPEATGGEVNDAVEAVRRAAVVVLVTLNLHLDPEQLRRARRVIAGARRVIGVAACNPYDIDALPDVRTFLATYEYSPPALEAAARLLAAGGSNEEA